MSCIKTGSPIEAKVLLEAEEKKTFEGFCPLIKGICDSRCVCLQKAFVSGNYVYPIQCGNAMFTEYEINM